MVANAIWVNIETWKDCLIAISVKMQRKYDFIKNSKTKSFTLEFDPQNTVYIFWDGWYKTRLLWFGKYVIICIIKVKAIIIFCTCKCINSIFAACKLCAIWTNKKIYANAWANKVCLRHDNSPMLAPWCHSHSHVSLNSIEDNSRSWRHIIYNALFEIRKYVDCQIQNLKSFK